MGISYYERISGKIEQQGREKENYEMAEKMIAQKFPASTIAIITGLPLVVLQGIASSIDMPLVK